MTPPRNHDQNRDFLCLYCIYGYKTGQNMRKQLKLYPISDAIKQYISANCYLEFYQHESVLPRKICSSCRTKIFSQSSENQDPRPLEPPPDYSKLVQSANAVPAESRSKKGQKCPCYLCDFAAYNSICRGNQDMPTPMLVDDDVSQQPPQNAPHQDEPPQD